MARLTRNDTSRGHDNWGVHADGRQKSASRATPQAEFLDEGPTKSLWPTPPPPPFGTPPPPPSPPPPPPPPTPPPLKPSTCRPIRCGRPALPPLTHKSRRGCHAPASTANERCVQLRISRVHNTRESTSDRCDTMTAGTVLKFATQLFDFANRRLVDGHDPSRMVGIHNPLPKSATKRHWVQKLWLLERLAVHPISTFDRAHPAGRGGRTRENSSKPSSAENFTE